MTAAAAKAYLVQAGKIVADFVPPKTGKFVDAVGAGDAFSAAVILGLYNDWPESQLLQRACGYATATCEIQGAVSHDRSHYQRWCDRWC